MGKRNLGLELCQAVVEPAPAKVARLLAEGADPNVVGDRRYARIADRTPLWLAINNAGLEASTTWTDFHTALREVFSDVAERDYSATRKKFVEIVRQLIKAGADLEKRSFGGTPLRIAVHHRDDQLVKLLLEEGANPNAETFSIISKLVKRNSHTPAYYNTVLHEAVEKEVISIVGALLAAGADPRRKDHEGKTPLEIAREKNHTEILKLLEKTNSSK
jgi:ankyrin repeat protein